MKDPACICVHPVAGVDGDASKCDRLALCSDGCLARLDRAGIERLHAHRNLAKVIYVAHATIDDDSLQHVLTFSVQVIFVGHRSSPTCMSGRLPCQQPDETLDRNLLSHRYRWNLAGGEAGQGVHARHPHVT